MSATSWPVTRGDEANHLLRVAFAALHAAIEQQESAMTAFANRAGLSLELQQALADQLTAWNAEVLRRAKDVDEAREVAKRVWENRHGE